MGLGPFQVLLRKCVVCNTGLEESLTKKGSILPVLSPEAMRKRLGEEAILF